MTIRLKWNSRRPYTAHFPVLWKTILFTVVNWISAAITPIVCHWIRVPITLFVANIYFYILFSEFGIKILLAETVSVLSGTHKLKK